MRIWPAIDLKDGRCVRLAHGDYQKQTVYGSSPADMAIRWAVEGATGLHIADIDGAIKGQAANREAVSQIADGVDIDLQIQGGICDEQTIEDYLSMGIKRLIITANAESDCDWIETVATRYDSHLLIGIEVRGGPASSAIAKKSVEQLFEFGKRLSNLPVAGLVCTDVTRTGTLAGVNLHCFQNLAAASQTPLISAGGVSSFLEIEQLAEAGIAGCVVGRALYDGRLTLAQAISAGLDPKPKSSLPI